MNATIAARVPAGVEIVPAKTVGPIAFRVICKAHEVCRERLMIFAAGSSDDLPRTLDRVDQHFEDMALWS
ncbi:hypothetical protein AB0P37_08420 [Streptomyces antimycoticus]|uniref:hypothetical protein n=1 Tax=Streptomyces antimycoticus TaxID=68175 RepID=UPI00342ECDB6